MEPSNSRLHLPHLRLAVETELAVVRVTPQLVVMDVLPLRLLVLAPVRDLRLVELDGELELLVLLVQPLLLSELLDLALVEVVRRVQVALEALVEPVVPL